MNFGIDINECKYSILQIHDYVGEALNPSKSASHILSSNQMNRGYAQNFRDGSQSILTASDFGFKFLDKLEIHVPFLDTFYLYYTFYILPLNSESQKQSHNTSWIAY